MNKHVTINTASLAALCALAAAAAAAAAADASSKYGARAQHAGERPSPIVSFVYAHFSHFMCALRRHTNKCNNNQTETKKKTHTHQMPHVHDMVFTIFASTTMCVLQHDTIEITNNRTARTVLRRFEVLAHHI